MLTLAPQSRILVLAAHHDDEVLGCGATMRLLASQGHLIHAAILGEGAVCRLEPGREDEACAQGEAQRGQARQCARLLGAREVLFNSLPDNSFDSLPLLDVVRRVEALIERVRPSVVFTHFAGDLNVDHAVTARATLTACRPMKGTCVDAVLAYEVASSTEWGFGTQPAPFVPQCFFDVSGEPLEAKLAALKIYESEMRDFPHPRSYEGARHLAAVRGMNVGCEAAEAFALVFARAPA